jgi:hypothetical protein
VARVHLTKSRFKVGYECPTKLYYQDRSEFGNSKSDDAFLQALARGGFQVGALAQIYYPGGTEIVQKDKIKAAAETQILLEKENAIIYEAAFLFENTFIKADVVVKKENRIELIEVKAKSFDPRTDDFFTKSSQEKGSPTLDSQWEPYLMDVAFQAWVIKRCQPKLKLASFLMLADKSVVATVDGLNQRFFLKDSPGRQTHVEVAPGTDIKSIGEKILIAVPVDSEVLHIWNMQFDEDRSFDQHVRFLAKVCEEGQFVKPKVSRACKSCEFRIDAETKSSGKKSGFENCWKEAKNLKAVDFEKPWIFDIWNLHYKKTEKFLAEGKLHIVSLNEADLNPTPDDRGLSASERQWKQVEMVKNGQTKPFIDRQGLASVMSAWKYPFHLIDFETSMVAVPFNKRRPYEQIAFQFSHHIMHADGRVVHQSEYINMNRGHFPNFDFVRALKAALEADSGTIFRYAAHENTVLRQIHEQILNSKEKIGDRDSLLKFIDSITSYKEGKHVVEGLRNMVDLCETVKRFFYHPLTEGSNSIKAVLPAILTGSKYLQDKYSKPIYGSTHMPSKNFPEGKKWIEKDDLGKIISNPYKLLAPIFSDIDLRTMDSLISDGSIEDGGAAMTAYARMQFTQMSAEECERVKSALLRYCELDTLAMVLIIEYWQKELSIPKSSAA